MFIDTRSKESMESSMSTYLDIPVDELYQYIDYAAEKAQKDQWAFNIDLFYEELGNIISDLGWRCHRCRQRRMSDLHPTDFAGGSGMMQTAVKAKKPRKQALSGRFWATRTYRGRIKDDHKIDLV